jgi:ABC-type branched-subunit amino acid transport system ATPase component/ABC-type branched-subunit amino acid transport system permease subunit
VTVDLARELYLLIAVLGLALPVCYAGLPVLGQGAFVAVGALGTALLGPGGAGWPLGVAVLVAVTASAVAGWLVAGVAARLEGAALGLATWALAWLVTAVLVAFPDLSGGAQGLVRSTPAHLRAPALGLDLVLTPGVHVLIAAVLAGLVVAGLARLERGPAALDLAALRESPLLAGSLGIPVAARRRTVIAVSAALGGLAGAGVLTVTGVVAPADVSPLLSLQLLVAVLAVPLPRWWAAPVGAGVVGAGLWGAQRLAEAIGADPERARGVITALVLVLALALRQRWQRGRGELAQVAPRPASAAEGPEPSRGDALVEAEGLALRFGGVLALDGVDLALRSGEVHALIGPNGSGKSTLLRVLAGSLRPDAGVVRAAGTVIAPSLAARVRAGIARTPQQTVLVPDLAVAEQVAVGARGGMPAPGSVLRHLVATPAAAEQESTRVRVTVAALRAADLAGRGGAAPASLPVGEQRLLQIARIVATGAQVLLLDEPAAGMTRDERARLVGVLRGLAGNGSAVLLVEHDMALVGKAADTVTVLDAGRVIARGTPAQVRADAAVQRAYLGED